MTTQPKVKLAGSYKPLRHGTSQDDLDKDETIQVTVRLSRKKELIPELFADEPLSHAAYENDYGALSENADRVEAFAHEHQLNTVEVNLARRIIILTGKISKFELAFNVNLRSYQNSMGSFRVLTGEIHIPEELKDIIEGVFGLNNEPIARPMVQVATHNGTIVPHAAMPHAFTPNQIAEAYNFPKGVTGKGQCIAIIEMAGGYRMADITSYFNSLGLPVPNIKSISVDGGANNPTVANSWDSEVVLDIEVAAAAAPGAQIGVYFTANNDQGFLNAITKAIHDTHNKPSVISVSWGAPEKHWTPQAMDNFNEAFKTAAALGITICVGSGDSGSRDSETDGKVHVDFPASSPFALACGGTKLVTDENNQVVSEIVWKASNDAATGGGVSNYFTLPAYQANAGVPLNVDTRFKGRGLPDVAANAELSTGYKVLVDGQQMVLGGTSAAAPLVAGLIARINERDKKRAGFINPRLYANPAICRNITEGDNITTANNTGYKAGPGWNACTGWGVIVNL